MAFLVGSVNLQVYMDSAQTLFPQISIPEISVSWTDNNVGAVQPLYLNLAASGSQAINLNGLTGVNQFYIYSDSTNLNLTINGTAGFVLASGIPGMIPITLSSLTITNSSSSIATNVTLILIKG